MTPESGNGKTPDRQGVSDTAGEIARKARRKLRAQRQPSRNPLYGLGLFGLVGWAVTVPVLLGVALGAWIDSHTAGAGRPWTLALLLAGVVLGCLNAWYWIEKEGRDE